MINFFNCIYNVIYLRNSRFLQMIEGLPHHIIVVRERPSHKHFSIILADTSAEILTERQASSTIIARCVLETEAKKVASSIGQTRKSTTSASMPILANSFAASKHL
jgi:hypothetical protein